MAKGITKVEISYIANNSGVLTPEEIAEDLGRSLAFVKKHMETIKPIERPAPVQETKPSRGVLDMMTSKDQKGVVIMSKSASELGDVAKKVSGKSNRFQNDITKVYKD
jgi:hypothetical protein